MEPETLTYIWGGVLLFLWICLSIWVLGLNIRLNAISGSTKEDKTKTKKDFRNKPESVGNPGITPGDELSQRGYVRHIPNINPNASLNKGFSYNRESPDYQQPSFIFQKNVENPNDVRHSRSAAAKNENFMY